MTLVYLAWIVGSSLGACIAGAIASGDRPDTWPWKHKH